MLQRDCPVDFKNVPVVGPSRLGVTEDVPAGYNTRVGFLFSMKNMIRTVGEIGKGSVVWDHF